MNRATGLLASDVFARERAVMLSACGFDRREPVLEVNGERFGLTKVAAALVTNLLEPSESIRFAWPVSTAEGERVDQVFLVRPTTLRRAWPMRDASGAIDYYMWLVEGTLETPLGGRDSMRVLFYPTEFEGREQLEYGFGQLFRSDGEPDEAFTHVERFSPLFS